MAAFLFGIHTKGQNRIDPKPEEKCEGIYINRTNLAKINYHIDRLMLPDRLSLSCIKLREWNEDNHE